MQRASLLVTLAVLVCVAHAAKYTGRRLTSGSCSADEKELSCYKNGNYDYGCFSDYDSTYMSCCGCSGSTCYACKRSSIYCPSKIGGSCRTTLMPTWALVMVIVMPLGIISIVGGVLLCAFCCCKSSAYSSSTVAYSTPYVAPSPNPVYTSTPPPYPNPVYTNPVLLQTTETVEEVEMLPVVPVGQPAYNQPPAYYDSAPAGISQAYGGAGAGYVAPPPNPDGTSGHYY